MLNSHSKSKFCPTIEQTRAWVLKNFPDAKPRKNGTEFVINSPFDPDDGYHFNITNFGVHDWRGDEWAEGKSKTFLRFVQRYRNCSFVEALKEVCGASLTVDAVYAKIHREQAQAEEEHKYDLALPQGSQLLAGRQGTLEDLLRIWLHGRGVSDEMIEQYKLYYNGARVVWPYYEYGMLVYWQERDRLNKTFRFPPENVGVTKGMFLYGFDMVEPGEYVAITEAIFGSMTLGNQCVASGGAALTTMQAYKLKALNPTQGVILAPDNDKAGIKSLISNYTLLSRYFTRLYYTLPPKLAYNKDGVKNWSKDWNELTTYLKMTREDVRTIFEKSIKRLCLPDLAKFMAMSA